jgi:hypothetical protein
VTDAQIDAALATSASLAIQVPAGDSVELDCLGLSYCAAGGTGASVVDGPRLTLNPFPGTADGDGDGMGTITAGPTGDFQLRPGATSAELGSGDGFIHRVTTGGTEIAVPGILNYVFSTTPAIVSYAVDGGASGSLSYPPAAGSPGTRPNPIAVPASGDVHLHLTFWRPQRRPITGAGETGWMDIGGLTYTLDVPNGPGTPSRGPGDCPGALLDSAADLPADPAHQLTLDVDVTACLAGAGLTWTSGQTLNVGLTARSTHNDNAAENLILVRP